MSARLLPCVVLLRRRACQFLVRDSHFSSAALLFLPHLRHCAVVVVCWCRRVVFLVSNPGHLRAWGCHRFVPVREGRNSFKIGVVCASVCVCSCVDLSGFSDRHGDAQPGYQRRNRSDDQRQQLVCPRLVSTRFQPETFEIPYGAIVVNTSVVPRTSLGARRGPAEIPSV